MKRREKLTAQELTELRNVVRSDEYRAVEVRRAQAILLVNENCSDTTMQLVAGFSKNFASKLRKRYQIKGMKIILSRKAKDRYLLTKTQLKEVIKILDEKSPNDFGMDTKFWTTAILALYIKKEYNVVYKSKTSYCLIFKEAKFSYHKPDKRYHKQDEKIVGVWRKDKAPLIKDEIGKPGQVVFGGDEMIVTTQTTTQKVWLPKNKKTFIEASNERQKRCIYGFLDLETGKQHAFKTSFTNSSTTCDILQKLMEIYPDKKIVIVWDNAPWHRSKEVREFLSKHPGKFQLYAFPPYFPDENPQEHVWKAARAAITHNAFIQDIDLAADQLVAFLNQSTFKYKFL